MIRNNLPDNARAWIYQSTRKFSLAEAISIRQRIHTFVDQWTSHRLDVDGWGDLVYDRFVILMADEEQVSLGGCSIDSSIHFIKSLETDFSTKFFDRWNIAYKVGQDVFSANREDFSRLVEAGKVADNTIVFNNLVQTKADLLENWEVPYANSWLKKVALTNTPFNSLL